MSEQGKEPEDNPLDDLAAELSEQLTSEPVEISESSQAHVGGGQIRMKQSAARSVQASALHMEESAAGFVRSGSIDAHESAIGTAFARTIRMEKSNTSLLVAQQVEASDVRAFFVLSNSIKGSVRVALTPLAALAFGAGLGAAFWLLKGISGRIRRSSRRD